MSLFRKSMVRLCLMKNNLYQVHCASSFYQSPQQVPHCCILPTDSNATIGRRYSNVSNDLVCYSELKKLRRTGEIVIIDVRSHDETWRTGTMPGALCIPYNELEEALQMPPDDFQDVYCREKPDSESQILLICRKGNRSYKAIRKCQHLGYEHSKSYQGGFLAWFDQERINREKRSRKEQENK